MELAAQSPNGRYKRALASSPRLQQKRQPWATSPVVASPPSPGGGATSLPPLEPTSPRRDPPPPPHTAALPFSLEPDYPVARLDSWPLTSRAPFKRPVPEHSTPPPTSDPNDVTTTHTLWTSHAPAPTNSYLPSPISPRQRKARQHHTRLDESKTKPLLVQELDAFVHSELADLPRTTTHASRSSERLPSRTRTSLERLQVFRLVFQRLIAAFSVYAPVLAQVQYEYERVIGQLRTESLEIPKLHAALQTLQSHCVREIAAHTLETKRRSHALTQQLKSTQGRLTALAAHHAVLTEQHAALEREVERLRQCGSELQLSHHSLVNGMKRHDETLRHVHDRSREEGQALAHMASKYHHACDEIAELKLTIATLEEKVGGVHVAADKATIALLTHDLQDAHTALQTVLTSASTAAVEELQTALAQQRVVASAFVRVLDAQGVVVSERELLAVANQNQTTSEGSDWDENSVGRSDRNGGTRAQVDTQALAGAVATWVLEKLATGAPLRDGAASAAASLTFLTETEEVRSVDAGAHMVSPTELLVGRGFGPDVPEFLHYDGVVRNLRYPRKKLEHILARVWQHKDDLEKAKRSHVGVAASTSAAATSTTPPQTVPLAKVLSMMLQRTSASRTAAVESAYNIFAALERFAAHSSDCRLVLEILRGAIPEDARQDQLREVYVVHDALAALEKDQSASDQDALPGRVRLADVVQLLRHVFPWKTERALSALHRALLLDQHGSAQVDYATLLLQQPPSQLHDDKRARASRGSSGDARSHFAECVRAQYIDDLLAYRHHLQTRIERQLLGVEREEAVGPSAALSTPSEQAESAGAVSPLQQSTHGTMVAIRDLRDQLQACDVAKPVQEINRLLATASGLSLEQVLTQDALMVNVRQFLRTLPTLLVKPSGKF